MVTRCRHETAPQTCDVQVIQTLNVRVACNNVGYVIPYHPQRENTVVYANVSGFKANIVHSQGSGH